MFLFVCVCNFFVIPLSYPKNTYTMKKREIKFRAYLPDGHWAIDTYGQMIEDYTDKILFESLGFFTDDIIYMQYTGLKDKNGKEIYEGDILICSEYDGSDTIKSIIQTFNNAVVGFNQGSFYYYPKGNMNCPHQLLMYAYKAEVIGNIYENHELLK